MNQIIEAIKKPFSLEKEKIVVAKVIYFYNDKNKMATIFPLEKISPILESSRFNEIYALGKPAFFEGEIPIFILVREVPFSLELADFDEVSGQCKIKGYTASEIQAKINSIYTNKIYRKGSLQFKDYLVLILSNIITALSMYIIVSLNTIGKGG